MRAELAAGTYYIKVSPSDRSAVSYFLRRHVDNSYRNLVTQCEVLGRGEGVSDALAGCQWHLDNRGQRGARRGEDANVAAAHRAGHLGEGVHVAVVDTGINLDHDDLSANTDASRSVAYCGSSTAPFSSGSDHGTAVAGVIAARDNAIGMRGVAPRATLHNRRLLGVGCDVADGSVADALTHSMASVCVSSNSWGHSNRPGATPAPLLFDLAIGQGITAGCDGKGIVYVWSGGNGHGVGDDANLDELVNHYGGMAVCAVNASGGKSNYSETGASLWVCGPSNVSGRSAHPGIATLTNHHRYRLDFGGTSASAPVVAGVAALVRAANPDLTWRDVKLVLAASARRNDRGDSRWHQGAAKYGEPGERYWYNRRYGFGVVDASAAVELAEEWTNLPPILTQTRTSDDAPLQIPDAPGNVSSSVTFDDTIEFVEYVQIDTSFKTPHFRDLRIELVSPSGTEVLVVPEHWSPRNTPLNEPFRFGVTQLLGEPAEGAWTLRVSGKNPAYNYQASLDSWGLTLYGHRVSPTATNADPVFAADPVSLQVAENTASGTAVGEPVAATDVNDGATLTYTLSGAGAASFAIDGTTGQISTSAGLDHEAQATYSVTVSVSDGLDRAGQPDTSVDDSTAVSIEVLDVDEPPVFGGVSRRLDNALPGFLVSLPVRRSDFSDPDGDALTFSLSASPRRRVRGGR